MGKRFPRLGSGITVEIWVTISRYPGRGRWDAGAAAQSPTSSASAPTGTNPAASNARRLAAFPGAICAHNGSSSGTR